MAILMLTFTIFAGGLMVLAAFNDAKTMTIPNEISLMLVVLFCVTYMMHISIGTNAAFQPLSHHLIAGGAGLIVMMGLFFIGAFGGGDAKLIAAICLWVGYDGLPEFLMVMALTGGVLALMTMATVRVQPIYQWVAKTANQYEIQNGWVAMMVKREKHIPYAIAIATGGIMSFRSLGYLP